MQELFKCETCGASFGTQAALMEHANVHSGTHQHEHFKCDGCGAAFHSAAQLSEHVTQKHPMPRS